MHSTSESRRPWQMLDGTRSHLSAQIFAISLATSVVISRSGTSTWFFNDGIIWVVRLRLPDLPAVFGNREALDAVGTLVTKVTTIQVRTTFRCRLLM